MKVKPGFSSVLLACLVIGVLFTSDVRAENVTVPEESLLTFDATYVYPKPWYVDLEQPPRDLPGIGVEYFAELAGAWDIWMRIGGASPTSDFSPYSNYVLTFTNTSPQDSFNISLYIKTGDGSTYYESGWSMFLPGKRKELSLDLTSIPLDDLRNVTEVGFGLGSWRGSEYGYAETFQVKVEGAPPIPEASTLMLFGTGLVGLLAVARRKLSFLTK